MSAEKEKEKEARRKRGRKTREMPDDEQEGEEVILSFLGYFAIKNVFKS